MSHMAGRVRVGISSWTEPTLIKSGAFYPPDATTAEERLRFYAEQFPIVEVDSTFYALPNENTAALWVDRTPSDFIFDVKAFALLTQHPAPPERLPKDLRERLGVTTSNVYFKDLKPKDKEEIWERFRAGLQPLVDARKLGTIVFQFPKWFLPNPPAYRFMEDLREWVPDAAVAVEFRQQSWMNEVRRDRVLQFLKDHRLTYVGVDEPQGFTSSVPPSPRPPRRWPWFAFTAATRRPGRKRELPPPRSSATSTTAPSWFPGWREFGNWPNRPRTCTWS